MDVIITYCTVVFLILSVLLVIIILLQSDKSAGMGILGGSSQTTFGSSTADVMTKITGVMVAIFMFGSLALAIFESYRKESPKSIQEDLISSEAEIPEIKEEKGDTRMSDLDTVRDNTEE